MPKVKEDLRDAQILAEFSNLTPSSVDYFRHNYPDFVPQPWWDYVSDIEEPKAKRWQSVQKDVCRSWDRKFAAEGRVFHEVSLLLSVFDPNAMLSRRNKRERPAYANVVDLLPLTWPFQKAVSYLFHNPWRARFCAECGKRFVAAEPKNKFCSTRCGEDNRNRQKRAWFHKNLGAHKKKSKRGVK
jgi:hypothetical protein